MYAARVRTGETSAGDPPLCYPYTDEARLPFSSFISNGRLGTFSVLLLFLLHCLFYTTRWRTPSLCWAEPGRLHWNSFCCSLQSCESLFCIHYTSGPHTAAVVELQHPACPAACRPLNDLIVTVISCVQAVAPGESSEKSINGT